MNVDYEIISKAITFCVSIVLDHIVHPDQTCSVPGRSIFSNVTLLRDVLMTTFNGLMSLPFLISLDQEKASKELIKEMNSILYCFSWLGKDKVKRHALISGIEMGGPKMLENINEGFEMSICHNFNIIYKHFSFIQFHFGKTREFFIIDYFVFD